MISKSDFYLVSYVLDILVFNNFYELESAGLAKLFEELKADSE